jgi:hypothetical protein
LTWDIILYSRLKEEVIQALEKAKLLVVRRCGEENYREEEERSYSCKKCTAV